MSHRGWGPIQDESVAYGAKRRDDTGSDHGIWWELNGSIRFYGLFFLATAKFADAVTTAVGLQYIPGIVELNPVADAIFLTSGTVTGLVVLSFATVGMVTMVTEWLSVTLRLRYGLDRLALLSKTTIYGTLSALFGWIAFRNSLLISGQVQAYLTDLLVVPT